MTDRRQWAFVTGASSGIGLEIARELARRGFDLVVCAEDEGVLAAAEQLRGESGREVHAVRADLRRGDEVERAWVGACGDDRVMDVVALNAGVGQGGAFIDNELQDELDIIALNVVSTVRLAKRVLPEMVARGSGRVLITSSVASTMPGSYQAIYNASKSFLQSFTEAVQQELADTPVTLTALMPGPTGTNFFHRAGMAHDTVMGAGPKDDAAQVARQGVEALLAGRPKLVAGSLLTKAQAAMTAVLPDRVKARIHATLARPR